MKVAQKWYSPKWTVKGWEKFALKWMSTLSWFNWNLHILAGNISLVLGKTNTTPEGLTSTREVVMSCDVQFFLATSSQQTFPETQIKCLLRPEFSSFLPNACPTMTSVWKANTHVYYTNFQLPEIFPTDVCITRFNCTSCKVLVQPVLTHKNSTMGNLSSETLTLGCLSLNEYFCNCWWMDSRSSRWAYYHMQQHAASPRGGGVWFWKFQLQHFWNLCPSRIVVSSLCLGFIWWLEVGFPNVQGSARSRTGHTYTTYI